MITFIYTKSEQDIEKEKVLTHIFKSVSKHIKLPDNIEVELKNLDISVYGETMLDSRFKNRIRLNANLSAKEVFKPFIHELVHISQTFNGKLGVYRNGTVMWEGKPYITNKPLNEMPYKEHSKLPWEQEASYLQDKLVSLILEQFDPK